LIVLFAFDLEHHLLPNAITLPGIVVGFLFSVFAEPGWLSSLIGAAVGGGALLAVAEAYYRVRHEEGLGMGDVKMLAMIGAVSGVRAILPVMLIASTTGAVAGVALAIAQKRDYRFALPFGVFLGIAFLVMLFFGVGLMDWYVRMLLL
jgi:leader peptidase (prepilin peptidase)/N-methyltransferase